MKFKKRYECTRQELYQVMDSMFGLIVINFIIIIALTWRLMK